MPLTLPLIGEARPRNWVSDAAPHEAKGSETDRNGVALAALNSAIDAYCAAHQVKHESLAAECGTSKGNFSRMLSGRYDQAVPLHLLDVLPRALVSDFLARMSTANDDPLAVATEQFLTLGLRLVELARAGRERRVRR